MGSSFKSRLARNFASCVAPSARPSFHFGRLGSKACFLACMVLPLAVAPAHAEQRKHLPTEELEKYEDPPMYIFSLGVSAQMVSRFGAFTSYQVNVDANGKNITGDAANEPSIYRRPDQPQQDGHRLEAVRHRVFQLPASRLRIHQLMAAGLDISRCARKQCLPQRSGSGFR